MSETSYENESIKRAFFEQLRGGKGFTESSIKVHADGIAQWETFTEHASFSTYNKSKAAEFVKWLAERPAKTPSGKISLVTQANYLRRVKKFFEWLSEQPRYKSKILKDNIAFLRLSKKDAQIARMGTTKRMPTLEDAEKIIMGIEPRSEIDHRDRALISLALITGARISALISLKMKNFNKTNREIDQNPADGVRTKNSKKILTTFFPIGWDNPEEYFVEWYGYLEEKGFGPDDPIFPHTTNHFGSEYSKEKVAQAPWESTGSARKIFKKRCENVGLPYFHPHSFRHLIVNILSKRRLTEEEKRAISMNLGHENVGTTFGSYGYGGMTDLDAVKIVQKLKDIQEGTSTALNVTEEEKAVLTRVFSRNS